MIPSISEPVSQFRTPVLFLVFNRPDTTLRVFQTIRAMRPARLFVAADGPRHNNPDEKIKCDRVRDIASAVDWDCEVHTLFRNENLGCRKAVSSGIDWFFKHVSRGIILEDDCLPSHSFYLFCQELLEKYVDNKKIMHISGFTPHHGRRYGTGSYYFSRYNLIWGWATWKRAWKHYDDNIDNFQQTLRNGTMKKLFRNRKERYYFTRRFTDTFHGDIDSWAYIWLYSRSLHGGFAIHPNTNLIRNIGFSKDATHTTSTREELVNHSSDELTFPLVHPIDITPDILADSKTFRILHCPNIFLFRLSQMLKPIKRIFRGKTA